MSDPYDLGRFVVAQERAPTFLDELRAGRKTSHWMWFVFPQLQGLGESAVSKKFAITSLDEARAYLRHPVLGPRLRECVRVLTSLEDRDAEGIFGPVDAMKLRSSLTLFARAAPDDGLFEDALRRYFDGAHDARTDALL